MTGTTINQYRITAELGQGGMGEVYRALDTRLNRQVAIKVLPKIFAAEPDRLRRFEQEAKTLAALNHPNILTIYDAGVHEGTPYLVSELLEGQTLRAALSGTESTPFPVRKAAEHACQIAHGLAAAHGQRVIHRDLKPENIFVTRDGRVKILDFGLAKLSPGENNLGISGQEERSTDTPTLVESTQAGVVLGTPAYMSPEQVRGEPADDRSDIFAFGCVLYEMLAGKRAFRKDTGVETMTAILSDEPPELSEYNPRLPAALARIVRRCLEKVPARRFQSATDLAFAIETAESASTTERFVPGEMGVRQITLRSVLPWAVATAAVAASLALWFVPRRADLPPAKTASAGGSLRKFELTLGRGAGRTDTLTPVLSPDGQKVIYASGDKLWLRRMDTAALPVLLASGESIAAPFWSPQSTDVGYFDGRKLYRVPAKGGRPNLVAVVQELAISGPAGGAWVEGEEIVFTTGPRSALYVVPAGGGKATNLFAIAAGDWDFHNVTALPGRRGLLFVVHRTYPNGVDTLAAWTPQQGKKTLLQIPGSEMGQPVYSPTGHVLFHRNDESEGIWAFRFSLETLDRTGEPFRVSDAGRKPSVAADGTLLFSLRHFDEFAARQLAWLDRSGMMLGTIEPPLPGLSEPQVSPDGSRIVAAAGDFFNAFDLWIFNLAGGGAVPFTRNDFPEQRPFWRSDGGSIFFTRRLESGEVIMAKELSGTGQEQLITQGWGWSLSRSGRFLLALRRSTDYVRTPAVRGYIDILQAPEKFVPLPEAFRGIRYAVLSPDDRLMAFQSDESGQMEVYLVDFPGFTRVKTLVSRGGGQRPAWNPNGSELFFLSRDGSAFMSATLNSAGDATAEPAKLFDVPPSIYGGYSGSFTVYDVAPDGQRFLMLRKVQDDTGASDAAKPDALLIQNWQEEFPDQK